MSSSIGRRTCGLAVIAAAVLALAVPLSTLGTQAASAQVSSACPGAGPAYHDDPSNQITSCSKQWMSGLPNGLPLSLMSIPGTHDSATYDVSIGKDLGAQTQSMNIKDQLDSGIRILHVEFRHAQGCGCPIRDSFQAYHGILQLNHPLYEVFDAVNDFLTHEGQGETVLIRLQNLGDDPPNDPTLNQQFYDAYWNPSPASGLPHYPFFDPFAACTNGDPTLGQMRNKIVLLDNFSGVENWNSPTCPLGTPFVFPEKNPYTTGFGLAYGHVGQQVYCPSGVSPNPGRGDCLSPMRNTANAFVIQDNYNLPSSYGIAGSFDFYKKVQAIGEQFAAAAYVLMPIAYSAWLGGSFNTNTPKVPIAANWLSATGCPIPGICATSFPDAAAQYLNPYAQQFLLMRTGAIEGLVMMDFPGSGLISEIINLNFDVVAGPLPNDPWDAAILFSTPPAAPPTVIAPKFTG